MSIINSISIRMQTRASEEIKELREVVKRQDKVLANKDKISDALEAIDLATSDGILDMKELGKIREQLQTIGISTESVGDLTEGLQQKIEGTGATYTDENGNGVGYMHLGDMEDWARPRQKEVDGVRDFVKNRKDECNDDDDKITNQIQLCFGRYNFCTESASKLEKAESDHNKSMTNNL